MANVHSELQHSVEPLNQISLFVGVIGVGIIVWGVLVGLLKFVKTEWSSLRGSDTTEAKESLRHQLGYYLLLGLEFLIAADIIHTVLTPSLGELAILGSIVAIRTVISFSINWELRQSGLRK